MISLTTPVLISNGYHSIFIINLEFIPTAKIIGNKKLIPKIDLLYAENKSYINHILWYFTINYLFHFGDAKGFKYFKLVSYVYRLIIRFYNICMPLVPFYQKIRKYIFSTISRYMCVLAIERGIRY